MNRFLLQRDKLLFARPALRETDSLERHSEEPKATKNLAWTEWQARSFASAQDDAGVPLEVFGLCKALALSGWRHGIAVFSACVLLLNSLGCTHPISERLRSEVDSATTFSQVFRSPESYIGKKVVFGGTIVRTTNLPDMAEIEVVQKELDSYGYPDTGDATGGRFIFTKSGYVEPEIYAKGREITGAGSVVGSRPGKVDDRDYRYPVISAEELYLWERKDRFRSVYPYWGYWGGYSYYPYSAWRNPYYW